MPRTVDVIRFNTLRNALYHTARRRSLEWWNRVFNFAVVVLGTAAVAGVAKLVEVQPLYIGMAVAVIGALQLVLDFGGGARTHQGLQRDYYNLIAEIEEAADCDDEGCRRQWEGKLTRISADEPPTLRAIDARAYNDAIDALDWPKGERLHIPFFHQLFGGLFTFSGHNYAKLSERPGWKEPAPLPAE